MPKYRKPQGRSVRPTFFVFCEGETEEEYVSFLRSHFRVPKYKKGHIDKNLREILAEKNGHRDRTRRRPHNPRQHIHGCPAVHCCPERAIDRKKCDSVARIAKH